MTPIQIRLTFIIAFALMGMLLGNDGYHRWYVDTFLDSTFYSGDRLIGMLSLILYVGSLFALAIQTIGGEQSIQTEKLRGDDLLVSVSQGGFLTGAMMFYAFMAGPISQHGTVLSPWLIAPMSAVLPLIPLLRRILGTQVDTREHKSDARS